MTKNENDLQNALNRLTVATGRMELRINVSKTMVLESPTKSDILRLHFLTCKQGRSTKKKVEINEQQLSEVIKVDTLKGQMQRAVDHMKEEYVKNLSLRSTTGSMESLQVNFDGKEVTKEHRENLAKNAKTLYVKCRDSIKDVQNKFIKDVKTKTNISQDDSHLIQDQIVCIADQYVSTAEKILEAKHTELIGKD
uniref:Ribosome-recycling factor, mitochondrial n=1 Tax=Timema monikensis TaxID=170555 RepID=A0A7R9DX54_9NEOP|nr:unnamed protein product [Timema monikensis]